MGWRNHGAIWDPKKWSGTRDCPAEQHRAQLSVGVCCEELTAPYSDEGPVRVHATCFPPATTFQTRFPRCSRSPVVQRSRKKTHTQEKRSLKSTGMQWWITGLNSWEWLWSKSNELLNLSWTTEHIRIKSSVKQVMSRDFWSDQSQCDTCALGSSAPLGTFSSGSGLPMVFPGPAECLICTVRRLNRWYLSTPSVVFISYRSWDGLCVLETRSWITEKEMPFVFNITGIRDIAL